MINLSEEDLDILIWIIDMWENEFGFEAGSVHRLAPKVEKIKNLLISCESCQLTI